MVGNNFSKILKILESIFKKFIISKLIWNFKPDFKKIKSKFRSFFPFCKKARSSLDVQLEKFVYTKTHLAKLKVIFLRAPKKVV